MRMHGDFCYQTDIGNKRKINEDCAIILNNSHGDVLLAVCDGLGGHKRGDEASSLTISLLQNAFKKKEYFFSVKTAKKWLEKTIKAINEKVYLEEKDKVYSEHMGTTLVACLILKHHLIFVNIGDSRGYILRILDQDIVLDFEQATTDDTIADYLVNIGRIKKEERENFTSRHVLTNAVGLFPSLRMEIKVFPVVEKKPFFDKKKEKYVLNSVLLCSDGLFSMLNKDEILHVISSNEDVENKVETLISMARNNGGDDNIAVALWERNS